MKVKFSDIQKLKLYLKKLDKKNKLNSNAREPRLQGLIK